MIIETKNFKDVNRAPYNPRIDLKPGMPEYEKLKKSIGEFGHVLPMVFNKRSGNLVGGHQTMTVLEADNITKAQMSIVDLDDANEKALNIALNKIGGDWEGGKLSELLGELSALPDFDIELTGFDVEEVAALNPDLSIVAVEDDYQNQDIETNIKTGDIINLGQHKLLCGDAKDKSKIIELLDGVELDLLFYDPPYEEKELWDCYIESEKVLIFTDNRHILEAIPTLSKYEYVYEFVWDTVISWYLNNRPMCRHRSAWLCQTIPDYNDDIVIYDDGKIRKKHNVTTHHGGYEYQPLDDGVRLTTVYCKNKVQLPAQYGKPIEWIAPIIAGSDAKNVLDLFGGSGSTLMACEQLDIPCFVVEIDPVKCQNIVNRFNKS